MPPIETPTWQDNVAALFAQPYWIDPNKRDAVGAMWKGCMDGYGVDLGSYESVKQWAITIYHHLHSRSMPLTDDPTQYWPDGALETFRAWVNQGYRQTHADPIDFQERIPPPDVKPLPMRVRRDILSLSQAELDDYRMRLDDILRIGDPSPDAPAQRFAYIHGDWCLHYQEAFLMWHRAYLIQFEALIGMPVPYWNWFAQDAWLDGSPSAGLPQAFKDLTYIHPQTGQTRPNPLRFAAAKDGRSKACANGAPAGIDCRFVQRFPVLYTSGDDDRAERERWYAFVQLFQDQVVQALRFDVFSTPQGSPGYPWANLPSFTVPQPDSDYPYRTVNFDGLYEQPHDNFHGWVGPDMADNAYTSFDPVFWSYHANIDRVFEIWLREHPAAMFTARFPIRPFAGAKAERLEFDDPRSFVYTTIGDLARDSRSLGYDFAAPQYPDVAPAASATANDALFVVFDGVRCTMESYTIDAFLNQPTATATDVDARNPHYVGRFTRLGMGVEDDKGRCIKHGVRRVLDATRNVRALGLRPNGGACDLHLLVTDLTTGQVLTRDEYARLPGFAGRLMWGEQPTPVPTHEEESACSCH